MQYKLNLFYPKHIPRLREANYPVRLCTNESQCSTGKLAKKLQRLGYNVEEKDIYSPITALKQYLLQHSLRPHLLLHPGKNATDYAAVIRIRLTIRISICTVKNHSQ